MVNSAFNTKKRASFKISEIYSFNKCIERFLDNKKDSELQEIIELCLNSSTIVKNNEGQIFLSKIISKININIHNELMAKIKSLIPKLSTHLILSYGKIIYLLWLEYKIQNNLTKVQDLEEKIQESLCLGSIRVNPILAVRIRLLMHHFHDNRDRNEINSLLIRLYDPIIWRFLSVANWKVRFNSTAIFALLFPLIESSMSPSEYKFELDRQYAILQNLLSDNYPEVRVAAIQAVCRILTLYWEITPTEKIQEFMRILTSECIEDKSSHNVRIAAITGINIILNNPLSQGLLKNYLKKICLHINDLDPGVRYSTALMILKISRIEGINYTQIVSKKQLLTRISKEFIIYQLKQCSYYIKNGILCQYKSQSIGENTFIDQETVFASLKIARILSELLNPSIFFEKTPKEQLKHCHIFCEQCPIGIIGYFNSLKIPIEENIGRNIPNSELLRLSVLLITSTIESYKKGKIKYNKASILLESSKELLKTVFEFHLNISCKDKIENSEETLLEDSWQSAIDFFVNACNDELFDGIDPKNKIWMKILQILLSQNRLFKKYYPKLCEKVISELWNLHLSQIKNTSSEIEKNLFNVIIPVAFHWRLLDQIYPILINGCSDLFLDRINNLDFPRNDNFSKLDKKTFGILCLQVLVNILRFSEIRNYLRNQQLIGNIEDLAKNVIYFYNYNVNLMEFSIYNMKVCNELFLYLLIILKKSKEIDTILISFLDTIERIVNYNEIKLEFFTSYYELFTSIFIFNESSAINQFLLDKIVDSSKFLPKLIKKMLKNNEQENLNDKITEGLKVYFYGIKQLVKTSNFKFKSFSNEIETEINEIIQENV